MKACPTVYLLAVVAVTSGIRLSCDNYNPLVCTPDSKMYCLLNGTRLTSTCDAQGAICGEGAPEATDLGCCLGTSECVGYDNAANTHGPAAMLTLAAILFHLLRHVHL